MLEVVISKRNCKIKKKSLESGKEQKLKIRNLDKVKIQGYP